MAHIKNSVMMTYMIIDDMDMCDDDVGPTCLSCYKKKLRL
jgi:hypothetical protein